MERTPEEKAARAAYMRTWYQKPENAAKVKTWSKRYKETNPEKVKAQDAAKQKRYKRDPEAQRKIRNRALGYVGWTLERFEDLFKKQHGLCAI
ncbi:MAG: hypothetical protein ABFE02_17355, partial [Sulfuricella sp.]